MNKDNPLMIVLGNKSDVEQKEVQENDISEFIEQYGIEVIEASAKSAFNIDTIMKKIGVDLLKKLDNKPKKSKLEDNTTYKLGANASDKEKQSNKLIKKCNCA